MGWVGFDIETSGVKPEYALQPWRAKSSEAWIRTSVESTATENIARVYDPQNTSETCRVLTDMVRRWVEENHTICTWNATFEIAWLSAYVPSDLLRKVKWLDGMLLWRHLENAPEYDTVASKRRSYGLKEAVKVFLPDRAGYDEGVDFHGEDVLRLLEYNALDSRYTRAITKHLYDQLAQHPRRLRAAMIETHCLFDIAYANYTGVTIDRGSIDVLRSKLTADINNTLAQLREHGATATVISSPVQLRTLLFETWGLEPIKHGKTGASTDKETLHELSAVDPRVNLVRTYREMKNNRTKFVDNILAAIDYNNDGRAHPIAKVFGTYSGRLTYASAQGSGKAKCQIGWAVHQMKRSAEFRNLVVAPKGYSIVEFDAAGQEFRWMAELSEDETMRQLCQPGQDAHAYMGASIQGLSYEDVMQGAKQGDPVMKSARQLGKVANLCVAGDTMVLTDRGLVPIVDVTLDDRVWDGEEFVTHEGVVCSGVRPVITYCGLTATPDHLVLVDGRWERLDEAKRHGWKIESSMGPGWALRAGQSEVGDTPGELSQQAAEPVYDIVNCGPRRRFSANGLIVHNSLQYRTSANKLRSVARVQYGMDMDEATAQKVHRTYQRTYLGVPRYWKRQIQHISTYLYVDTLAGRRVNVSRRMLATAEWSVQSTSINYPVQGTGADQKYLALSVLRPLIERHRAQFLLDLHDGLYFLVPDEELDEFIPNARYLLNNLPYEKAWGYTPSIPLPFDCKVGKSWGSLEEL